LGRRLEVPVAAAAAAAANRHSSMGIGNYLQQVHVLEKLYYALQQALKTVTGGGKREDMQGDQAGWLGLDAPRQGTAVVRGRVYIDVYYRALLLPAGWMQ
jgi:hypothetical protein